ncbi:hypothetical protein DFP92_101229 [Yoonia sediminilitoris]|uniref:Uncharacterized protein n=1 Tax=Yoonia sediminilitoris TaxID=1286148 RepID=A0A2T6KQ02_9RHOB|nr:hypothetical protein C8N45_101229 [Yoonia sediminilitoris]RCW98812.1 hypothetical protein DFP92_101229 [Yoonia sediminilitoris]
MPDCGNWDWLMNRSLPSGSSQKVGVSSMFSGVASERDATAYFW